MNKSNKMGKNHTHHQPLDFNMPIKLRKGLKEILHFWGPRNGKKGKNDNFTNQKHLVLGLACVVDNVEEGDRGVRQGESDKTFGNQSSREGSLIEHNPVEDDAVEVVDDSNHSLLVDQYDTEDIFFDCLSSSEVDTFDPKGKKPKREQWWKIPILTQMLGESSNSSPVERDAYCNICMESKFMHEFFVMENCSHLYCVDCVGNYVQTKLEENVNSIRCPDPSCKDGYLEPEMCRYLLKPEVLNLWGFALCEAMLGSRKLCCPYKDCSALFIDEREVMQGEVITSAECPHCHRLFCSECRVPWHAGVNCKVFATLGADERAREVSESSNPHPMEPDAYCNICMEPKFKSECFTLKNCTHLYCALCVEHYVEAKVEENVISIRCPDPGCKDGYLEPEMCRYLLKPEVFNRWGVALCEAMIGSMKFYCPYKDCSALLIDEGAVRQGEAITSAECPYCNRLFCAQCKVPWHAGVNCDVFAKLGADEMSREDIMLRNIAESSKWQRCPKCKFYVERISGCMFIQCRCGYKFCYGCATEMKIDHYCPKCKR